MLDGGGRAGHEVEMVVGWFRKAGGGGRGDSQELEKIVAVEGGEEGVRCGR